MNSTNERTLVAHPDASVHELMNGATEWLQYAQRLTGFMSEVIENADELQAKEVANALMVIDALLRRGLDFALQAHTQMVREQLHAATGALATN
jgi:hypothetical protein